MTGLLFAVFLTVMILSAGTGWIVALCVAIFLDLCIAAENG